MFAETTNNDSADSETTVGASLGEALRPVFVPVKAGTFMMGSPTSEQGRRRSELRHSVTLTKDFEMGVTEVTQLQWFTLMGSNPSLFNKKKYCPESHMEKDGVSLCPGLPVEHVSYEDVKAFIGAYNRRARKEGDSYRYRLPTEAEWEYAARGGTQTAYSFGNNPLKMSDYVWHRGNSNQNKPVATKKPNPLGLYDIHGNVWEWVQDWYGDYPARSVTDPKGRRRGFYHVIRGGSRHSRESSLRSANRGDSGPEPRSEIGFRLARTKN